MPRRSRSFPACIVMMFLGASLAFPAIGQDLAALARKERARRAKIKKPAPAYGDGRATETEPGDGAKASPPADSTVASAPSAPIPAPDAERPAWKARAEAAREAIVREEATLAGLDVQIATLSSDTAPLSAQEALDPMRLQKRDALLKQAIAKRETHLEVVANAKKALEVLEETARRSGIPPGWLR